MSVDVVAELVVDAAVGVAVVVVGVVAVAVVVVSVGVVVEFVGASSGFAKNGLEQLLTKCSKSIPFLASYASRLATSSAPPPYEDFSLIGNWFEESPYLNSVLTISGGYDVVLPE
jgi:hypothetical protein